MDASKTPLKRGGRSKPVGKIRLVEVRGNYIHLEVCGAVTADDAEDFSAIAEALGRLPVPNLLLDLKGAVGWDPCALAHRIWTTAAKPCHFAKLAIVCNSLMQQLMAEASKPLFSDRIRVFEQSERFAAQAWLASPQLIPVSMQQKRLGFRYS